MWAAESSPLLPGQADCRGTTARDTRGFAAAGALAVISPAPRRRAVPPFDPCAYANRHHIEQAVNKVKQHRRLATRYDKADPSFQAFVCARIMTLYLS